MVFAGKNRYLLTEQFSRIRPCPPSDTTYLRPIARAMPSDSIIDSICRHADVANNRILVL